MEDSQRKTINDYVAAYNRFDVDAMCQNLHQDIVFENQSGGQANLRLSGIAAFAQQAQDACAMFSERRQTIVSWHFAGDTATVGIDYTARLAIDMPNGMKTGQAIQLTGESVFQFAGDLIVKIVDKS